MNIDKIRIKNFRLLKNTVLDMKDELSLLIGKNNSGKTSLLVLFEKFYNNDKFSYDDFSLYLRDEIDNINSNTDVLKLSIQMVLEIKYDETDNLENLSEFILDLDPDNNIVKILFEVMIKKDDLLLHLDFIENEEYKTRYIKKNLNTFLTTSIYSFENDDDLLEENRYKLIKKDIKQIRKLINFQIIHAKRNVSSSDDNKGKQILSNMTTKYFSQKNEEISKGFTSINEEMIKMDNSLNDIYLDIFDDFLKHGKDFLDIDSLKVISNLESNEIVQNSSKVIYGDNNSYLPEHLNGLGFMNILYLLLDIEAKKSNFIEHDRDINLLFLEEPEAHTHPQMQYRFIDKIKKVFKKIDNLQTIITTHSPQIVSRCDFKDIRYLLKIDNNIQIKNFYNELKSEYGSEEEQFRFVAQYLTLQASELFFAKKIIFIEGTTERILLPYFIKKFDEIKNEDNYIPISSQNISIIEVGANAKAFDKLVKFLDIKTLIITDIDTTKKSENDKFAKAHEVSNSSNTSNATLKYYLNAPNNGNDFSEWFSLLLDGNLSTEDDKINIFYQIKELDYHARSFEDAFIRKNLQKLVDNKDELSGIKNKHKLTVNVDNIYKLTEEILDKKSDFAFSILYLALSKNID